MGAQEPKNKHPMPLLCKWAYGVYSVGPVNAELGIVTLYDSRASRNLLILAAMGWGGLEAAAQLPAALFNVRGIVLRAECSSSSSNSKALHYSAAQCTAARDKED